MTTNGHSDGITGAKLEEDAQYLEYQAKREKYGKLHGEELEEPAPFELAWVDLAESTRDLPPTEWLVPGLITVGESTLLVGAPKSGKTLFLLDLLRAMTQTGKFLGFNVVMGRMWLLSELTPRTIKGQMRLLNFEPNEGTRTAYLTQQRLADITPKGVLDDIRRAYDLALRDGEAPAIVVLDTMGRWLSGKYLDYNAYGDMSAATTDLLALAADLGTCHTSTLVSHHANKSHKAGGGRCHRLTSVGRRFRQRD